MADYEVTTTVDVAANVLFDYLSDVERLPEYLPQVEQVHRRPDAPTTTEPYQLSEPGETGVEPVDVEVRPDGAADRTVRGEAWIEVVEDGRRLRWGAPGSHDYHGELDVDFVADGTSLLTVRLHTEHAGGSSVEKALEESVAALKTSAENQSSRPRNTPSA